METRSYGSFFDDTGWGYDNLSSTIKTSNPYQSKDFNRTNVKNNQNDQSIKWLLRPLRVLDFNHVEMFRPLHNMPSGAPQNEDSGQTGGVILRYPTDFFRATSGGKYGLFTYEVTTPRVQSTNISRATPPDGNGPYSPVFYMTTNALNTGSSTFTPTSKGPLIKGTEVTGIGNFFDKTTIASPVTRLVISENTLQHYRSDAPRRRELEEKESEVRRMDYAVKPRFSQSLHPKGHKGDVTFSVSDHDGDAS